MVVVVMAATVVVMVVAAAAAAAVVVVVAAVVLAATFGTILLFQSEWFIPLTPTYPSLLEPLDSKFRRI